MLIDTRLDALCAYFLKKGDGLEGTGTRVPKLCDHMQHRGIIGRLGNGQVKAAIGIFRHHNVARVFSLHFAHQRLERIQQRIRDLRSRERRGLSLDKRTRLQQFERTNIHGRGLAMPACQRAHIDARPGAHLDQPVHFQRDHRLANGGTADAILLRQLALGGHALIDAIIAAEDLLGQYFGDAFVKTLVSHRVCLHHW